MVNVQFNKRLSASFGAAEVVMIATVASELGRNILKYGGGRGHLLVSWFEDATGRGGGVEIKAVDQGPGFHDTEAALKDHYSTGGTLGLGLPGAARIMDSLEIEFPTWRGRHRNGEEMGEAAWKVELNRAFMCGLATARRCPETSFSCSRKATAYLPR